MAFLVVKVEGRTVKGFARKYLDTFLKKYTLRGTPGLRIRR
jgi:hypothetical protein